MNDQTGGNAMSERERYLHDNAGIGMHVFAPLAAMQRWITINLIHCTVTREDEVITHLSC
jgi:hypothetical protein